MEGFYSSNQLPPQELKRQQTEDRKGSHPQPSVMEISSTDPIASAQIQMHLHQSRPAMSDDIIPDQAMMAGGPLDEIIRGNHNEMQRRRSMSQVYGHPLTPMSQSQPVRRMSAIGSSDIMAFGTSNNDLSGYSFDQQMAVPFANIDTTLDVQDRMGNYMTDPGNFSSISPDLMGSMMSSQFANMDMGQISTDPPPLDIFSVTHGPDPNDGGGSISERFSTGQLAPATDDFSIGGNHSIGPNMRPMNATQSNTSKGLVTVQDVDEDIITVPPIQFTAVNPDASRPTNNMNINANVGSYGGNLPPPISGPISSVSVLSPHTLLSSTTLATQRTSSDANTLMATSTPREQSKEKTVYSKSGFDMLKALWLVATRKNPKIHLGAVDMSCAFVVCDVTMNDCPIIYVSDNFQNLTGYSRHEIVGQNCRFLQAPDGKVEAGSKREFVDDGAVYSLKKMIQEGREVQQSLINYRKGGKPFLNLLTMIPIPWDSDDIRYFIGFQIDLVECPDAISGQEMGGVKVNYKHSDIGQYIWTPPSSSQWEPENGQTLGVDDVSTLLQQFNPNGLVSDWHKQSWDKMLLENTDDVVHVLSLKGLFLYLSPACKRVLEYDGVDLVGNSLSSVCHPSDIVPVTRELKDATAGNQVNIVFRIRRKQSGYTWFESHGSLFVEHGKGRKCIILVGRKRPVFALSRRTLEANGGIGDSELWTKLSTSGMFLSVSANVRSLLDLQPEALVGTSLQELMRKESRAEFGRTIEKARRGKIATCKHEVLNRRGQGLQAQTILYPGDASEGQKPSFLLAQTKLLKASTRNIAPAIVAGSSRSGTPLRADIYKTSDNQGPGQMSQPAGSAFVPGSHDAALASDDNVFDELRTTKCSSWQFELRQMEKVNRILAEELGGLLSNKKKRKRRKGVGNVVRDCANCHTRNTPEWRRGPSGQRDLCNSCGLRWAKQTGRVSPRNSIRGGNGNGDTQSKKSTSPIHSSPLHRSETPNPGNSNGEGSIDPAELTNKSILTPSGATSATGHHQSSTMPPPSQSSLTTSVMGSGMASIREEREASQT